MVGLSGVSVGPAIRPPLTGGVTSNNYIPPNNASPPYASGTGLQSLTWTNPSFHNNLVNSALSGNQSALGAMGGAIVALGGGLNDIGALLNATNKNILSGGVKTTAPRPSVPTAGVVDTRTVTQPVSYNQPYTDNSQSIAISLPDMFSAQPMLPPSQMDFGQMAPLQPMNIPRPVTPQPSQPIPAAVSMGVGNLPMAATPAAAVSRGGSPVNLQPQQARSDQQLPEVSPVPQGLMPQRQPEMPPVAPRYAPPPMAVPNPYAQQPMQPPMNPFARPMPPMPPQMQPQRFGNLADAALIPPRQFYQGPPQQKQGFLARLGRGMQAAAGGLNPSIGATQAARARAQADVQMKMIEMDAQGERNYADNRTRLAERIMQEESQNNRTDYIQQNENYRQQLSVQAQGRLSQSQGMEMLGKALAIVPTNQADMLQKQQMLAGASQALGQDFTGMLNQTSTEGSNAALKQAMEFKKDAMQMLEAQNKLQMQPIENDLKRLQLQTSKENLANVPLERQAKRLQIAKTSQDIIDANDPVMRQAKRAEALAKSEDVQRRPQQDFQQSVQRDMQMGSSMIAQANNVLVNESMSPGSMTKEAVDNAKALLQKGQALMQGTYDRYQGGTPGKSTNVSTPRVLQDPARVRDYLQKAGGDPNKARAMATADGWVIPQVSASRTSAAPAIGMR